MRQQTRLYVLRTWENPSARAGFTILELLVVMAILGIVLALVVMANNSDRRDLRADQTAVAQLFERARTIARRYSYDVQVKVSTDGKSLSAQTYTTSGVSVPAFTQTVQLARATSQNPGTVVIFDAPFGRLRTPVNVGAVSLEFRLNARKTYVDLVGVIGKVISRQIE